MTPLMTVAEVAARSDISPSAVRYYHRLGLLKANTSTRGGHRRFDDSVFDRLRFIRSAQRLGLSLAEITELLSFRDGCTSTASEEVLRRHLATLEGEVSLLQELQGEIESLLKALAATAPPRPPGDRPTSLQPTAARTAKAHGTTVQH